MAETTLKELYVFILWIVPLTRLENHLFIDYIERRGCAQLLRTLYTPLFNAEHVDLLVLSFFESVKP